MCSADKHSSSPDSGHTWVLVQAFGGSADGETIPPRFRRAEGIPIPLHAALDRAMRLAPPERVVVTVSRDQRRWWESLIEDRFVENLVVLPSDRGSAVALMLTLAHVLRKDPEACVVALSADHVVAREEVLHKSILEALSFVAGNVAPMVLLGISPHGAMEAHDWIVPRASSEMGPDHVSKIVESPDGPRAEALLRTGALLANSMFVDRADLLLGLLGMTAPVELIRELVALISAGREGWGERNLRRIFARSPTLDLSTDILGPSPESLSVLKVPTCGGIDLGRLEKHGGANLSHRTARTTHHTPAR